MTTEADVSDKNLCLTPDPLDINLSHDASPTRMGVVHKPRGWNATYRRHLRIETVVPRPRAESIAISSISRRVPGRPIPNPVPVLNPSRSACSTFAIPGP